MHNFHHGQNTEEEKNALFIPYFEILLITEVNIIIIIIYQ